VAPRWGEGDRASYAPQPLRKESKKKKKKKIREEVKEKKILLFLIAQRNNVAWGLPINPPSYCLPRFLPNPPKKCFSSSNYNWETSMKLFSSNLGVNLIRPFVVIIDTHHPKIFSP
jgi:hypothetical protein